MIDVECAPQTEATERRKFVGNRRGPVTKQHLLCDAAIRVLRQARQEMHYTALSAAVCALLGIQDEPARRFNTMLHDDRTGQLRRTGRGTWALKEWAE